MRVVREKKKNQVIRKCVKGKDKKRKLSSVLFFPLNTSLALLFKRQDPITVEKLKEICSPPPCPAVQRMQHICNANIGAGLIRHLMPGLSEHLLFECKHSPTEGVVGCSGTL